VQGEDGGGQGGGRTPRGCGGQRRRSWQRRARGKNGNQPAGTGPTPRAGAASGAVAGIRRGQRHGAGGDGVVLQGRSDTLRQSIVREAVAQQRHCRQGGGASVHAQSLAET
jgi:hypothetical protein